MSMDFYNKFFSDIPKDVTAEPAEAQTVTAPIEVQTDTGPVEPKVALADPSELSGNTVRAKKAFSRIFLALALYQTITFVLVNAAAIIMSYVFPRAYAYVFLTEAGQLFVNALAQYAIALPVAFLVMRGVERKKPTRGKVPFGEFVVLFLLTQVLSIIGNLISSLVEDVGINIVVTSSSTVVIEPAPLWLYAIFVVILAPVFEEILMRKLVIDRLSKYGTGFAVVVSAAAFGVFHGNFTQMFYAALGGLVLGYLYIKGGLKLSIAMHMLFNLWGSVVAMIAFDAIYTLSVTEDAPEFLAALAIAVNYIAISIIILVFGIINLIKKIKEVRRTFHPFEDAEYRLPKGRMKGALIANGGMIYFFIISGVIIFSSLIFALVFLFLGV